MYKKLMMKNYLHLSVLFYMVSVAYTRLTSNLTRDGVFCPGEVIVFTCILNSTETILQWRIRRSGPTISSIQFTFPRDQPPTERTLTPNVVNATAAVISTSEVNIQSILTVTAGLQLDDTTIECSGISTTPESVDINIAGLLSPPLNLVMTIIENRTASVTVNIDWDPPNGGGVLDRYTVETSPETATVRVTSDTRAATLDLSYNVRYNVRVTAENCIGSSTPATIEHVRFGGCSFLKQQSISNQSLNIEQYTSSSVGSVISYQCRPGFIPEGRMISVCGGDGRWNPDPELHNCSEVNCGSPILPVNTNVLHGLSDGARLGSEVTFRCNKGLFPSSEITIVCTSEQRWFPDPQGIQCVKVPPPVVDCGSPRPPENGMVTNISSTLEGSEVKFQCNVLTAVCSGDGRWSPDPGQQECTGFQQSGVCSDQCTTPVVTSVVVSLVVVCSVVFYFGGFVSAVIVYLVVTRCKKKNKQGSDVRNTERIESHNLSPVYEDVESLGREYFGVELQENVAYGQIKK